MAEKRTSFIKTVIPTIKYILIFRLSPFAFEILCGNSTRCVIPAHPASAFEVLDLVLSRYQR